MRLLLRRLPALCRPVLPSDYARIEQVLDGGRRLTRTELEHLLQALLAKDAEQRRVVSRELRGLFPPDPVPEDEPPGTA